MILSKKSKSRAYFYRIIFTTSFRKLSGLKRDNRDINVTMWELDVPYLVLELIYSIEFVAILESKNWNIS